MKKDIGLAIQKIVAINQDDFRVTLKYTNGFTAEVDLQQYFNQPRGLAREVLMGGRFSKCFVESGALAWPNGLEFCPDALFRLIKQQSKATVKVT